MNIYPPGPGPTDPSNYPLRQVWPIFTRRSRVCVGIETVSGTKSRVTPEDWEKARIKRGCGWDDE
ncbi:hypothetical protein WN48_06732 [Eufriesea mexicana]|uniref:Uncharacterized protein n=1 Tax=Eufriesea mexicana TaxID=516756 RepID=A0A310SPI4_9HYME|nr:hypothetical protein WN48_06732 [Eufriesea mexicana]